MTSHWVDAAYPPPSGAVAAVLAEGYIGCGFYLPDQPASTNDPLNQWTSSQVQDARNAGFGRNMVGIWLPDPSLSGDPTVAAQQAFRSFVSCGGTPTMSGLYNGNHIGGPGGVSGPVWLPIYTPSPPASVGSQSAIQWSGGTIIGGWEVDLDVAADDFPWNQVIMVDFEHNTNPDLGWYQTFQQEITVMANAQTPPIPTVNPGTTTGSLAVFANTAQGSAGNQELFWVDGAGQLWHAWYNKVAGPTVWHGPVLVGVGWMPGSSLEFSEYNGIMQVWGRAADGIPVQCYWSGKAWVVQPTP